MNWIELSHLISYEIRANRTDSLMEVKSKENHWDKTLVWEIIVDSEDPFCASNREHRWWCIHPESTEAQNREYQGLHKMVTLSPQKFKIKEKIKSCYFNLIEKSICYDVLGTFEAKLSATLLISNCNHFSRSWIIGFFLKFKICQICQINCDGKVDCIWLILVLLHI